MAKPNFREISVAIQNRLIQSGSSFKKTKGGRRIILPVKGNQFLLSRGPQALEIVRNRLKDVVPPTHELSVKFAAFKPSDYFGGWFVAPRTRLSKGGAGNPTEIHIEIKPRR